MADTDRQTPGATFSEIPDQLRKLWIAALERVVVYLDQVAGIGRRFLKCRAHVRPRDPLQVLSELRLPPPVSPRRDPGRRT